MEMVGILIERRADRIVLSTGIQIFVKEGVLATHLPIGRSVTVSYTDENGQKVADDVRLNPDWLLDSVEALALASDPPPAPRYAPAEDVTQRRSA